jgi:hypothetical protein
VGALGLVKREGDDREVLARGFSAVDVFADDLGGVEEVNFPSAS